MNPLPLLPPGKRSESAGLLALRLVIATSLLLKHGLEKVFTFSAMAQHFPDPVHIGPVPSLLFAMIADFICSLLMIVGLATRWAAAIAFLNILVAWALVHHFAFFGRGPGEHGELVVLYLGATLTLYLTGAGGYSLDNLIERKRPSAPTA